MRNWGERLIIIEGLIYNMNMKDTSVGVRHDNKSRSTDSERQNQVNENLNREIAILTQHINNIQVRKRERDQWDEKRISNLHRGRRENVVERREVNAVTKSIRLTDVTFNGDVKRTNPRWLITG